jgi:hypothetical protein
VSDGCNEHLNTQYKILEISGLFSVLDESRFGSKENQDTLPKEKGYLKLLHEYFIWQKAILQTETTSHSNDPTGGSLINLKEETKRLLFYAYLPVREKHN